MKIAEIIRPTKHTSTKKLQNGEFLVVYDKKKRHGEHACPFNSLYWDFYERHRDKLSRNPRIGFAYRTLNKMAAEEKSKTLAQAARYLDQLEAL